MGLMAGYVTETLLVSVHRSVVPWDPFRGKSKGKNSEKARNTGENGTFELE